MASRLADSLGYHIHMTANKMHTVFSKFTEPIGVAPEQYGILMRLRENGPMTHTEIAQEASKAKPTVSRLIAALERKGMIVNKSLPNDKRTKQVHITDEGMRVLDQLIPTVEDLNQKIRESLSEQEIETFLSVLQTVLHGVETYFEQGESR